MKFKWSLTEEYYKKFVLSQRETIKYYEENPNEGKYDDPEFVGSARIGNLCFDILDYQWGFGFDLYVGDVDTGYGESYKDKIPYDLCDEAYIEINDDLSDISFDEFKSRTENEMVKKISEIKSYRPYGYDNDVSLIDKMNEDLKEW